MNSRYILLACLSLFPATVLARGAVAAGQAKAKQVCAACHGENGDKPLQPEYPILFGQHADYLAKALKDYIDVLAVLHLICPDQKEMVRRMRRRALKENRLDDADEKVIHHRFDVYRKETEPVLSYYPADIIHEVPATESPSMVLMSVLDLVAPIQDHHFKNPLTL